jgi:hypothetical protein
LSAQNKTTHFESERTKGLYALSAVATLANVAYSLPRISEAVSACTDDSWAATSLTNVPAARDGHTAVWTGSERIVWGGDFYDGSYHYLNTGGRYNPNVDSWTATNLANAPSVRGFHTAVWTGSEMIVWGGYNGGSDFITGGRYDPGTDSWTATNINNAPTARLRHTAVWTGTEKKMIVWGGYSYSLGYLNTGGRYCAATQSPTPTPTPRPSPTPRPRPTLSPRPTS